MLAVDTNVVIRYLTKDDAHQSAQARALVDGSDIYLTATVLLEADWVLRSAFKYSRQDAVAALRAFSGLPTINLDQPSLVALAFDWALHGMDFADALHLAASKHCDAFMSFDRDLAKIAKAAGAPDVRCP